MNNENNQPKNPFEQIGEKELSDLVDRFYSYVSEEPELMTIFPQDLTETARKQKQFLTQFLGGEPLYSNEHGHPMLRARHMPFSITRRKSELWLTCMKKALSEANVADSFKAGLFERLTHTAKHMINTEEMSETSDERKGDS